MPDIFDEKKRSLIMSSIRSKGNKSTEMKLISIFKSIGIKGWRRNYNVKGHPDFVFMKQKIAIFVDGCFWHGHNCRNTTPKTNTEYWDKKRKINENQDQKINELFQKRGWLVIRIWECELKNTKYNHKLDLLTEKFNIE